MENNTIKYIKWGVIIVLVLLLLKCSSDMVKDLVKANKPTGDTLTIHTTDTIWAKDTTIIFKPKKIFITIHDTTYKPIYIDTSLCHRVYVSRDTFKSKDIDVFTIVHYQGVLREIKASYKSRIPIRIIDSVKQTIKVPTLYPPTVQLQIGGIISKDLLAAEVGVGYKRNTIGVGYNFVNKIPTLRYSYTVFRK